MLEIKDSTLKRVRFRISKVLDKVYDYQVKDFITLVVSEPSWALQHLAYEVSKMFEIKCDSQLKEAQIGADILEVCDGIFYDLIINYQPLHDIHSGRIVPKIVYGESETKSIEPRTQVVDNVEIKCSKRFWRKQNLNSIQDVINYLGNTKYKLNNYILEYKDNSYKDSAYPELESSRAKEMYDKFRNKTLFFDWFIDARGRVYSKGYHINVQGTKYKKAVLDLVTEPVKEELSNSLTNLIKGK